MENLLAGMTEAVENSFREHFPGAEVPAVSVCLTVVRTVAGGRAESAEIAVRAPEFDGEWMDEVSRLLSWEYGMKVEVRNAV